MQQHRSMCRALFSVSNKTGILEFAQALSNRGIELLSTGNTASLLKNYGLPVIEVSDYTGFPEIMDGRIKTLHPKILGGILGRRGQDDIIMAEHDIHLIDIIVVNFYPFGQVIEKADCTIEDAIKNIDIGGPTMVRAAAKNYKDVVIVVKSNDYQTIIKELDANNNLITLETRFDLAIKAFEYTAAYDSIIANYFGKRVPEYFCENKNPSGYFPRTLNLNFIKKQNLRYGENYHQRAAFYIENTITEASIAASKQLHGKELSFNNIADADTALECVKEFSEPACVIVKHANPCGVAVSDSIFNAYKFAYKTDPTSAFGGIIAFNRTLDVDTAQSIINRQFVEVIIAPFINKDALKVIKLKQNIRLLICGYFQKPMTGLNFKQVNGGLLIQDRDLGIIDSNQLHVVTNCQPSKQELLDALFCWKVVKFVKSNAIVYARDNMTVSIGAGQMSRIYSAKIAGIKANEEGLDLKNSVMASDAFFPFRDSIDTAATVGISCIIQPGGSIRDTEVIAAANEHNIAMIFTGMRHFRH